MGSRHMSCSPSGHRLWRRLLGRGTVAVAALSLGVVCLGTAACAGPAGHQGGSSGNRVGPAAHRPGPTGQPARPAGGRPNVVFVLTDDLSMNLVPYMPQVLALQKSGTTFSNYTVTDSLCCPSRSSIFSGKAPHNTGVFTNSAPDGGFRVFHARGEENETFATALQRVGYRTALMGKYLNGYPPERPVGGTPSYVPPGWTEWDVSDDGYPEYNYTLNENHQVRRYGQAPRDYLTDVLSAKGQRFIAASAAAHSPFFLEVATFAPHGPYTPAPSDVSSFPGLVAPRTAAFDNLPTNPPAWQINRPPLTVQEQNRIDTVFRLRVQSVQAVDRMIAALRAALTKAGVADNTVVVFSSDNGYHLGEYRLGEGKMSAYDTDVHVPLVAAGPGVQAGQVVSAPAQNTDLCPTFEQLGGAPVPADVDGHSLVGLVSGPPPPDWRTAAVVEHHGPDLDPNDPDHPGKDSGNPPTYNAMRTNAYTYVEYTDGTREYYDRVADPEELHNIAPALRPDRLSGLHAALAAMTSCHGGDSCWKADHLAP